jgi:hypothetical protein
MKIEAAKKARRKRNQNAKPEGTRKAVIDTTARRESANELWNLMFGEALGQRVRAV